MDDSRDPVMTSNRLLVVDDALIIRQRIRAIAEEAGWQVAGEAKNGNEAIALYQQEKPNLVTLDIVMPDLDGVSALIQIMKLDPEARVIMVSAVNQRDKLAECIRVGALDFVVKPFEKAALRGLFERYFIVGRKQEEIEP